MNNKEFIILVLIAILGIYYFVNYKNLKEKFKQVNRINNESIRVLKGELHKERIKQQNVEKSQMFLSYPASYDNSTPYDFVLNFVDNNNNHCEINGETKIEEIQDEIIDNKGQYQHRYQQYHQENDQHPEFLQSHSSDSDNQGLQKSDDIQLENLDNKQMEFEFAKRQREYIIDETKIQDTNNNNTYDNNSIEKINEMTENQIKKTNENILNESEYTKEKNILMDNVLEKIFNKNKENIENIPSVSLNCGLKFQPMQTDWKKFLIN